MIMYVYIKNAKNLTFVILNAKRYSTVKYKMKMDVHFEIT